MARKKRMLLVAREEEAARRAGGPASNRGFLRALVASVTRPPQRSAADTIAALRSEVPLPCVLIHVSVYLGCLCKGFFRKLCEGSNLIPALPPAVPRQKVLLLLSSQWFLYAFLSTVYPSCFLSVRNSSQQIFWLGSPGILKALCAAGTGAWWKHRLSRTDASLTTAV